MTFGKLCGLSEGYYEWESFKNIVADVRIQTDLSTSH